MKKGSVKSNLNTDISKSFHMDVQSKDLQKTQKSDTQGISAVSHMVSVTIDPNLSIGSFESGKVYRDVPRYEKKKYRFADDDITMNHNQRAIRSRSRKQVFSHASLEYCTSHQDMKTTRAKLKAEFMNFKDSFSLKSKGQNHLFVQSRNHDKPKSSIVEPVEVSKISLEGKIAANYLPTPKLACFPQAKNLSITTVKSSEALHAKPSFPNNFPSTSKYRRRSLSYPQEIDFNLSTSPQLFRFVNKRKAARSIALTHIVHSPKRRKSSPDSKQLYRMEPDRSNGGNRDDLDAAFALSSFSTNRGNNI